MSDLVDAVMRNDLAEVEKAMLAYFKDREDEAVVGVIEGFVVRAARRRGPGGKWEFRFWTEPVGQQPGEV